MTTQNKTSHKKHIEATKGDETAIHELLQKAFDSVVPLIMNKIEESDKVSEDVQDMMRVILDLSTTAIGQKLIPVLEEKLQPHKKGVVEKIKERLSELTK